MKSSDELKTEIREHDSVIATYKPRATNPPPFPTREVEGYKWGEATDTAIEHAQITWRDKFAEPNDVVRAHRLKREAEAQLVEVEKREAEDAATREAAAKDLEQRLKNIYMTTAGTTEASWAKDREQVLSRARVDGYNPVDERKRELLSTGRYQPF